MNSNHTPGFGNAKKDRLRKEANTRENNANIEIHQRASEHFSRAAKHHLDASKYHYEGDNTNANQSALMAIGEASLGLQLQMEDAKRKAVEH